LNSIRSDELRFGDGILSSDVKYSRSGTDLIMSIFLSSTNSGSITVKGWFAPGLSTTSGNKIESIVFKDGTKLNFSEVSAFALNQIGTTGDDILGGTRSFQSVIHGGTGNDSISGADVNDSLYGDAGNDSIFGDRGNDWIEGGDGDDILDGGYGADVLIGGDGNDTLGNSVSDIAGVEPGASNANTVNFGNTYNGGVGNDTIYGTAYGDIFIYNIGDGNDIIYESSVSSYGSPLRDDELRLGDGISPSDVNYSRIGTDLIMNILDSGTITVKGWFTSGNATISAYKIEKIKFSDGTTKVFSDPLLSSL
jgi:Ca2+-binding RTX toxin-like protein